MSIDADKATLRASVSRAVARMRDGEREHASERIVRSIADSGWWQSAGCALIYASDGTEPDVDALIEIARDARKPLAVPGIDWASRSIQPRLVRSADDLEIGRHGIRVPRQTCQDAEPGSIDLVLVPGVAFDRSGGRLGRGGGFYDRFLASGRARPMGAGGVTPTAFGVGFAAQIVERVPMEPHDQRMDGLVTDAGDGDAGMEVRR
ncbi:MAG: 5-formyltetrahydrofolate cyclo-ligase [Planctomycetota bacterium]